MKVKEFMIKEVQSLSKDISVKEAMEILSKRSISGLPVLDKEGRLIGMFTEKSVLSYILPSYIEQVGKFIYEEDPKAMQKKFAELSQIKVERLMRKEVVTVTPDTSISEAARIMLTQRLRRVPVLGQDSKVVGIISRCDVLEAFTKLGGLK